jgi:hypothetical protein
MRIEKGGNVLNIAAEKLRICERYSSILNALGQSVKFRES